MAVVLELKVIPGSKHPGFDIDSSGHIKCRLKNKPEGGKANEELIKMISKAIGISIGCFKILRGATSRNKLIKIDVQNLDLKGVLARLGVEVQGKIK
jgi:hypothetical protein